MIDDDTKRVADVFRYYANAAETLNGRRAISVRLHTDGTIEGKIEGLPWGCIPPSLPGAP